MKLLRASFFWQTKFPRAGYNKCTSNGLSWRTSNLNPTVKNMNNNKILIIGLLVTAGVAAFLFWPGNSSNNLLSDKTQVTMYKNEGCQCCTRWGSHMMEGEFAVEEVPVPVLMQVKRDNGITPELASCHTALIDGYVVEGHVPRAEVERLLKERPEGVVGLAVPGMPIGSPGMETPGRTPDNYDVLLVKEDGTTSVYASY